MHHGGAARGGRRGGVGRGGHGGGQEEGLLCHQQLSTSTDTCATAGYAHGAQLLVLGLRYPGG